MEVFGQHNAQMKALVGNEFAPGTLQRYKTSLQHTQSFIRWKYGVEDLEIHKLDFEFVSDYEFWLKSVRNCGHNSAIKYIANFRKIVNRCIKNGWLSKDPFSGFKMTKRDVDRSALTATELQIIKDKAFDIERLAIVRDIFVFCCFTGLAYADIKKLRRSEIGVGIDGENWIFTSRQKTETSSRIPLLPTTLELIQKYKDHPQCLQNGRLLPVLSNQKMNSYLKEIGDACGISKNFTFHIARHTFATTVTLENGVPIETVSKMLGHKNLRTTQHYAKILDQKVSNDMTTLRHKLKNLS
jgi:site-specific recombinase XerD